MTREDVMLFRRSWFNTSAIIALLVVSATMVLQSRLDAPLGTLPLVALPFVGWAIYYTRSPYAVVAPDSLTIQSPWSAAEMCITWLDVVDLQRDGEDKLALISPDESHIIISLSPLTQRDRDRLRSEIERRVDMANKGIEQSATS